MSGKGTLLARARGIPCVERNVPFGAKLLGCTGKNVGAIIDCLSRINPKGK